MPKGPNTPKVTLKDARACVRSFEEFYEGMQRNGYYLPKMNTSIVTVKWLQLVRQGKIWCPKYIDLRRRPCPQPPRKSVIIDELQRELALHGLSFECAPSREPDIDWLLDSLSTVNSNHRFFAKDYLPEGKESPYLRAVDEPDVSNDDGFFSGLRVKHKAIKKSTIRFDSPRQTRLQKLRKQKKAILKAINDQKNIDKEDHDTKWVASAFESSCQINEHRSSSDTTPQKPPAKKKPRHQQQSALSTIFEMAQEDSLLDNSLKNCDNALNNCQMGVNEEGDHEMKQF